MLKKLTNRMSSFLNSKKISKNATSDDLSKNSNIEEDTDLEITIEWDDIINGLPSSETNSIISNSFKRYGFATKVTACKVLLENGTVYAPQQLSDHWEAFIGSPKIKPKTIKYVNITNG